MRKFLVIAVVSLVAAPFAHAEHTRVTNPTAVGFELGGRALLYDVFFDRAFNDDMVAGFGFGTVGVKGADGSTATATMVPAYMNYYFKRDAGSLFASIGATFVLNSVDVETGTSSVGNVTFVDRPVNPVIGVGYESRTDSGFLFRVAAYAMYGDKINPWGGFSFGVAF